MGYSVIFMDPDGVGMGLRSGLPGPVLSDPTSSLVVNCDAVRIATWRGGRMFNDCVRTQVEDSDGVRTKFREPEVPVPVERQIERFTSFLQEPLVPLLVM